MAAIDALLAAREPMHGRFDEQAAIAQAIKQIFATAPKAGALSDMESEALDMIASKLGRILAGDPHHVDHWRDIAGYAQLVAMRAPA